MSGKDSFWSSYTPAKRGKRLLRMFVQRRNRNMTAKAAAEEFGDITRGCVTVFCKRWEIPLPRTPEGRRYYSRCRRLGVRPRLRRKHPRKYG